MLNRNAVNTSPKEAQEQIALFQWAAWQTGKYPELKLMHHIPNGGGRNEIEAARLKMQGVKKGIPDIFLPVARNDYHGLYIELKRLKDSRTSPEQKEMLNELMLQGYYTAICKGADEAIKVITEYLEGGL